MNSQQKLLEAINTISDGKNRSYDTPATVLRVEGDTVWVHIDGGADETPVQKTINCAEGETVQVRISNGSAFLVGNASAPPTDDTTANVAHFVAEQADEKATEAVKSVIALETTVEEECVFTGDSNIKSLSSTIYQNANGVSIYNNTLAVGDSYAHIDGDSFDIKQATSAGTIDDTNDMTLASFAADETVIGYIDETEGGYRIKLAPEGIELMRVTSLTRTGWTINNDAVHYGGSGAIGQPTSELSSTRLFLRTNTISQTGGITSVGQGTASFNKYNNNSHETTTTAINGGEISIENGGYVHLIQDKTELTPGIIHLSGTDQTGTYAYVAETARTTSTGAIENYNIFCVDWSGNVLIAGEVKDMNGNNKYAGGGGGGHTMLPTPSANLTESDVVTAVNAGITEGGTNDDVTSLFGIGKWSNVMSKTYLVKGTANNSPIGVSGIGNWPADLDNPSSADKATWIGIPALYGIGAVGKENIDLKISYDPAKSDTIVLGGWILSDNETMTDSGGNTVNCGKIAVKFGTDISTADTHTAVVGIEVIIKRTEVVDVSTL